jgi:hypothetical protein
VCRSTADRGGPKRCSADSRRALQSGAATITALEARQAAAQAALAAPAPTPPAQSSSEPARPKVLPRCFFCDQFTTNAAHMTRRGKVCCQQCWPDIRLTQSPDGGL